MTERRPAPLPARDLDPFARLRATTPARIGLGRSGDALPLGAQLDLQEAHARARDSVHGVVDFADLAHRLVPRATITVRSSASDRATYLRRPDLGRRVHPNDLALLPAAHGHDIAFVIADGLSAAAVSAHAVPMLEAAAAVLPGWHVAPIVLAAQARVAIGDEIGERLGATIVAVLIGERPGLTVSDSLGLYVTFAPRVGRADSERNCISNVHARGLSYAAAARLLAATVEAARQLGRTGVDLKIDAPFEFAPPHSTILAHPDTTSSS